MFIFTFVAKPIEPTPIVTSTADLLLLPLPPQPVMEFSAQVNAMQHLKEQLEQRTRMIQANIQRQQEELRHIQEQLQRVQGQGIQVWWEMYRNGSNESAFSYSTDVKSPVIQV